ncbi:MAG: hypothetical protein ACRCZF_00390 [Gemmataceae bacterium]
MVTYQYEVLFMLEAPGQPSMWFLSGNPGAPLGPNLIAILNHLGQQGWRVVGMGDFGNSPRSEILLARP